MISCRSWFENGLFVSFLLLVGCDLSWFPSGEVGTAIRKEVRVKGVKEVDLATVVPFKWDELYLFAPYTPSSQVCKELTISEIQCDRVIAQESMDDAEMYMIFKLNGNIVHQELYIRFNGDFTPIDYPMPIKIKDSRFSVISGDGKSASGDPWLRLVPVSGLSARGIGRSQVEP